MKLSYQETIQGLPETQSLRTIIDSLFICSSLQILYSNDQTTYRTAKRVHLSEERDRKVKTSETTESRSKNNVTDRLPGLGKRPYLYI